MRTSVYNNSNTSNWNKNRNRSSGQKMIDATGRTAQWSRNKRGGYSVKITDAGYDRGTVLRVFVQKRTGGGEYKVVKVYWSNSTTSLCSVM